MRRILTASVLAAPLFLATAAFASSPAEDATLSAQPRAVSTGVTEPQLLHSASVIVSPELAGALPADSRVVLKLNVDENGAAQAVQVIKSVNPELNKRVIDAVRQFRWQPATLDKQAVPVALTLNVLVQH